MHRRELLRYCGGAFVVGLAGCPIPRSENQTEGVILDRIVLSHQLSDPITFDVLVTYDDTIIHWDSYDLQPDGGRKIEVDGPSEPGDYSLSVRVLDEWKTPKLNDPDHRGKRIEARVVYGWQGENTLHISDFNVSNSTSAHG
jgi:hypothetical protein